MPMQKQYPNLTKGFPLEHKEIILVVMIVKRIYGVNSILGGQDFYDENGNHVGYSVPGIGGGEDFFWDNGETGYTVDSVIGNGQNYYGSDGTRAYTVDSVFDGQTIHGDISGFSVNSPLGGTDAYLKE